MRIARFLLIPVVAASLLAGPAAEARPRTDPSPVLQTRAYADDPAASPANADADDPAIWVHPRRPEQSVVLGALKEGGLVAFDLHARQIAAIGVPEGGRFNNVDVVGNLAVVSDRGLDRIRVYRIDPAGSAAGAKVLTDVTDPLTPLVFSKSESEVEDQRTAYGLAAGTDRSGARIVAVTQRHEARLALLKLVDKPGGKVGVEPLDTIGMPSTFRLPNGKTWTPCGEPGEGPQFEGSVLDSKNQVLYSAQEDVGVWRIPLSRGGFGQPELIEKVRSFGAPAKFDAETEECLPDGPDPGFGGKWLTADAEGLTFIDGKLLASSQGDSRFVYFGRTTRDFRVVAGHGTDSVEHSDGATVSQAYLGPRFPHGLLVVHDGERRPTIGDFATTGFAFVPLETVPR